MKYFTHTSLAIGVAIVSADDKFTGDVGSVISSHFPPGSTPTLAPAASTTLASLFNSIETSWRANPTFTSALNEITSAAPSEALASITAGKAKWEDVVTQSWYTKSVDKDVQSAVKEYMSAFKSAGDKVVSEGGAPRATGLGVAGVVGVLGGVLGAIL